MLNWLRQGVFGKGKVGGRNENYLNVRYIDGSEAGMNISKHEWRNKTDTNRRSTSCEEALVVMVPWRQHSIILLTVNKREEGNVRMGGE